MRRRGRAAVLAGVLVLLAGCGDGSPDDADSPRGTVEELKTALVEADADALRALLDESLGRTAISATLLTDEVLAAGALAGEDVEVDKVDSSSLEHVEYVLRVDDRAWLEVSVRRGGGLVGIPLPRVDVEGAAVPALRVDGVRVALPPGEDDEPSRTFLLPPGEHEVGADVPSAVATAAPPERLVLDAESHGSPRVSTDVALTPAGRRELDTAVRAWVDRCTEPRRGPRPADCPVRKVWVGADLVESRWRLAAEPTWTVTAVAGGFRVYPERTPRARMTGTVRDRATGRTEAVSDVVEVAVSGFARLTEDGLDVTVPER